MTILANLMPKNTKFDFVGKRWYGFVLSFIVIAGTIFLLTTRGLNFGIDFSGGILIEARTEKAADLATLRSALDKGEFGGFSLQSFGELNDIIIRIQASGEDQSKVVERAKTIVTEAVGGKVEFRKVDYVGPQVGSELVKSGLTALFLSMGAMLVYIWFRFEWQFGIGGVLALLHDAIGTLGFFSLTQLEFDLTSVAAVLTIVGYSINDSVVIYDRIRENMRKYKKMSLSDHINLSVNETISRTILTGGTVLLSLLGLIMFGGETLKSFSWAMFFGVLIGTYSSVYISAPVLLYTGVQNDLMNPEEPKNAAPAKS